MITAEHNDPPANLFRILSLDGGPSSFTMLWILRELAEENPDFLKKVNMFAGSSSGAFAALYLAKEMSNSSVTSVQAVENCIKFLEQTAACFRLTMPGSMKFLSGFFPLFDCEQLYHVLDEAFGEMKLGDLEEHNKFVSVQFFNATKGKTSTYNTSLANRETKLADVARATSAFHPLMPVFQARSEDATEEGDLLLDGIFSTNAPILSAIQDAIFVLRMKRGESEKTPALRSSVSSDLGRLSMLSMGFSIGTHFSANKVSSNSRPRRVGQPGPKSLELGWTWSLWRLFRGGLEKMLSAPPQDEAVFANLLLGSEGFHRFTPSYASRRELFSLFAHQGVSLEAFKFLAQWLWAGSLEEVEKKYHPPVIESLTPWGRILAAYVALSFAATMVSLDKGKSWKESKEDLVTWLQKNRWIQSTEHK